MKDKITLTQAIETLYKTLQKDEGYRQAWVANIAMSFKDECQKKFERTLYTEYKDTPDIIHKIANTSAQNFINLLCLYNENNS